MPQQGCGAFRELAIKGPLKDVFNEIISGWYSELFTAPPDPLFVHLKSSNSLTLDDGLAEEGMKGRFSVASMTRAIQFPNNTVSRRGFVHNLLLDLTGNESQTFCLTVVHNSALIRNEALKADTRLH